MKRKEVAFLWLLLLLIQSSKADSQVKISGPECIVSGTEYQYDLFGKWDTQTAISVCVEGGLIARNNSTCYEGKELNYVRIVWNDNTTKGKISITSSSGNGFFNVRPTRALQGGKVDSLSKLQAVKKAAIPRSISCGSARGGNCSPSFSYQWEQSDDNLRWTNVTGAVFQNLSFSVALNHTLFFRRKIFDSVSNSIAYSDVAIVVVK
jgi:hypothetical protein